MSKKIIIPILIISLILYLFINSKYLEVRSHEKYADEIGVLLSSKYFSNKITGKQYSVSDIFRPDDPLLKVLKEGGIIHSQSYFSYSNNGCISLITRKNKNFLGGFSDILITRYENGEDFMCGVNAIYSLNNDENSEALNIKCYNLAGFMTLAFVNTPF